MSNHGRFATAHCCMHITPAQTEALDLFHWCVTPTSEVRSSHFGLVEISLTCLPNVWAWHKPQVFVSSLCSVESQLSRRQTSAVVRPVPSRQGASHLIRLMLRVNHGWSNQKRWIRCLGLLMLKESNYNRSKYVMLIDGYELSIGWWPSPDGRHSPLFIALFILQSPKVTISNRHQQMLKNKCGPLSIQKFTVSMFKLGKEPTPHNGRCP